MRSGGSVPESVSIGSVRIGTSKFRASTMLLVPALGLGTNVRFKSDIYGQKLR